MSTPTRDSALEVAASAALAGPAAITPVELGLERPLPSFRRPSKEDALLLARRTFLAGERVDMQDLAARLGIARATLYSWVGSREQLLDEVVGEIAVDIFDALEAAAEGEGIDRVLQIARPLMETYSTLEPLRVFSAREPTLALKIFVAEDGLPHRRVGERLRQVLRAPRSEQQERALGELIDTMTQISSNLVWVTYTIGGKPQIGRAIRIIGTLLASAVAEGLLPPPDPDLLARVAAQAAEARPPATASERSPKA